MTSALTSAVVHCKREPYDVYIGRPGPWGNPFSHKDGTLAEFRVETVEEAVGAYRVWLRGQVRTGAVPISELAALHGNVLGCWCKPGPCHGDVLADAARWAATAVASLHHV